MYIYSVITFRLIFLTDCMLGKIEGDMPLKVQQQQIVVHELPMLIEASII